MHPQMTLRDHSPMVDPDTFVFCEHGLEPDECPTCGGENYEHPVFDPNSWTEGLSSADTREPAQLPDALIGIPLS